jgi:hypothetical protein
VKEVGVTSEVVHRYLESTLSQTSVPLVDRTDRQGDGSVRLSSIRIESMEQPLVIGTASRLRVTIEYVSDSPLQHPRFFVTVLDQSGAGIYVLDTICTGELPDTLPAHGAVMCETEPINLTPGCCCVDLEVSNRGVRADLVYDAARFDVEVEHFYPSGYMPGRDWAMCVIGQRWFLPEKKS